MNFFARFFAIIGVFTFTSTSASNHFTNLTINVSSSDSRRLKVIDFSIDQNAFMNVTYELLQPWNLILVGNLSHTYLFTHWWFHN